MRNITLNIAPGQRGGSAIENRPTPDTLTPPTPPRSLYIHTPFCFHKCHYCDFYSIVDTRDRMEPFVERLTAELAAIAPWARGVPLETVFVGGGTPTLLPTRLWGELLGSLHEHFDMSLMCRGGAGEFTVECNPETATDTLMRTLADGGVNRLSLGAQSFDPGHLKTLERWHDPANVARAADLARDAGIQRLSIDLIYAVPGQTVESCLSDVDRAIALGIEHISAYSLTYEPGTAMTARLERGEFTPVDEHTDAEMMLAVARTLSAAGFRRYEVSNFALPGAECRHNLAYWRQRQWLAAGPSASAHVAGWRWKNAPRLGTYLEQGPLPPVVDLETPNPGRALAERIMTGLRLNDGLDAAALDESCRAVSLETARSVRALVDRLRNRGLIHPRGARRVERIALTNAGMLLADRLASELMAIVDP